MIRAFKEKSKKVENIINMQDKKYFDNECGAEIIPYDYIISKLDLESQRILYSDYIVKQPKYWYTKFYSKSTYYRLKNNALDKFLNHINRH